MQSRVPMGPGKFHVVVLVDFIAEERGNLGSLVAFRPNTNSKIDKRSRISNARQIVLGDDPYSGPSCIVY